MKLLIVEDDRTAIQSYTDVIDDFNLENGCSIQPEVIESLEEAITALQNSDYDAAIVDLKLSSGNSKLEGLEVVKSIVDKLRFPVYIVSGSIGQVDSITENVFLKKRSRDCDYNELISELYKIYNTGITKILGKNGEINDRLNSIFWKHLSGCLDIWINDVSRDSEQKHKILLRYILLHIQEYLELTEESNFENYHPAEIYISPAIKPRVFTGDILRRKEDKALFIILTPSCDMAQGKANDILVAKIDTINNGIIFQNANIIKKKREGEEADKAKLDIEKMIRNNYSNKYHFLPKHREIEGGLINFQKLETVKKNNLDNSFERIASINTNFAKDIISRFSYYYSRQGSPDFDTMEIYKEIVD